VVHNTVASTQAPFSSIEWRFAETNVTLVNNLVTHPMRERDSATAMASGNSEAATSADFVDMAGYDLHLASGSSAIGAGVAQGATLAAKDIDGEARPTPPDQGADQR
jgi:hypothetical protein